MRERVARLLSVATRPSCRDASGPGRLRAWQTWRPRRAQRVGPPWCNGSTPAFGAVQSRFESWGRSRGSRQTRSKTAASAWPPPMHIVSRASVAVERGQLVGEGREHADAGRADRVPDRDAAAARVEARVLGVDAPVGEAREHLHRERLVELDHVEVVEARCRRARARGSPPGPGAIPNRRGSTPATAHETQPQHRRRVRARRRARAS